MSKNKEMRIGENNRVFAYPSKRKDEIQYYNIYKLK